MTERLYLAAKNERDKSRVFPAICFSELNSGQITVEISFAHCALGFDILFLRENKKGRTTPSGYVYPETLPGHLVLFHHCVKITQWPIARC